MRLITATCALALCFGAAPALAQEDHSDHDHAQSGGEMMSRAPSDSDAMMSTAPSVDPDAAVLGDPDAPVEIVEYASVTCPHCAHFHEDLFPHIKETWIDTGQAKLVMRPLPTAPVQLAVAGFLTASCAGEDQYFEVLGDLFATQEDLMGLAQAGGEGLQGYYNDLAADYGLTPEELAACFSDEAGVEKINASIDSAGQAGVQGTPSFLINGELMSSGDLPDAAAWDAAIQAALDAG